MPEETKEEPRHPEDRSGEIKNARKERLAWAKSVDPDAVNEFEEKAASERPAQK